MGELGCDKDQSPHRGPPGVGRQCLALSGVQEWCKTPCQVQDSASPTKTRPDHKPNSLTVGNRLPPREPCSLSLDQPPATFSGAQRLPEALVHKTSLFAFGEQL